MAYYKHTSSAAEKAEALLFSDDFGKDVHAWLPWGPSVASTQQQLAGTPNMCQLLKTVINKNLLFSSKHNNLSQLVPLASTANKNQGSCSCSPGTNGLKL